MNLPKACLPVLSPRVHPSSFFFCSATHLLQPTTAWLANNNFCDSRSRCIFVVSEGSEISVMCKMCAPSGMKFAKAMANSSCEKASKKQRLGYHLSLYPSNLKTAVFLSLKGSVPRGSAVWGRHPSCTACKNNLRHHNDSLLLW